MLSMEGAVEKLGLVWPRSNKMRCPAHDDKTPSLHLYRDKGDDRGGSFYCFSCGKSGDAIGFVALMTGEDVRSVYRKYAEDNGLERPSPLARRPADRFALILRDMRHLNVWFFPRLRQLIDVNDDDQLEEHLYYWAFQYQDLLDRILDKAGYPAELAEEVEVLRRRMERTISLLEEEPTRPL